MSTEQKRDVSYRQYVELMSLYERLLAKNANLVDDNVKLHNCIVKLKIDVDNLKKKLKKVVK